MAKLTLHSGVSNLDEKNNDVTPSETSPADFSQLAEIGGDSHMHWHAGASTGVSFGRMTEILASAQKTE